MRPHLGDSHNFGRRVTRREGSIVKPRALLWEQLLLSAESPLRKLLDEAAAQAGWGSEAFGFLPDLKFRGPLGREGGEVERIDLAPLPDLSAPLRRALARTVGRFIALSAWLGLADLHWENLALGLDSRGKVILAPLDVEMILADLARPTETKLLPDADPEVVAVCRHAAGVRRALPYLGKPVDPGDLAAMARAYTSTLALLDRRARDVAQIFAGLSALSDTPIRVCLRGTDEYVRAAEDPRSKRIWPPLLDAELEQLARGDIPYFFRLYGQPGLRWFGDASLAKVETLPLEGDVPQLDPMLSIARGLRSPSRRKLAEEGLFTLLGAFDHPSFKGAHGDGDLAITFRARTLLVKLPGGGELSVSRDLRAFVASVYLPCSCGEVRTPLVPEVTRCEAARR